MSNLPRQITAFGEANASGCYIELRLRPKLDSKGLKDCSTFSGAGTACEV
ncbi:MULTISPECIES: hypothetical protein [Rhodopirellula]|nr:hypothetical protein [Rhodopirellula sp. UBA1907]